MKSTSDTKISTSRFRRRYRVRLTSSEVQRLQQTPGGLRSTVVVGSPFMQFRNYKGNRFKLTYAEWSFRLTPIPMAIVRARLMANNDLLVTIRATYLVYVIVALLFLPVLLFIDQINQSSLRSALHDGGWWLLIVMLLVVYSLWQYLGANYNANRLDSLQAQARELFGGVWQPETGNSRSVDELAKPLARNRMPKQSWAIRNEFRVGLAGILLVIAICAVATYPIYLHDNQERQAHHHTPKSLSESEVSALPIAATIRQYADKDWIFKNASDLGDNDAVRVTWNTMTGDTQKTYTEAWNRLVAAGLRQSDLTSNAGCEEMDGYLYCANSGTIVYQGATYIVDASSHFPKLGVAASDDGSDGAIEIELSISKLVLPK